MFKNLFCTVLLFYAFTNSALARETIKVDREFGLERKVPIVVTPSGIVLHFDSKITSTDLTHLGDISFVGVDGQVCNSTATATMTTMKCTIESAPTMLLLRKIPHIEFENQEPTVDGTAMLYVNTMNGLYRFEITPDDSKPEYTEVEIIDDPLPPFLEGQKKSTTPP